MLTLFARVLLTLILRLSFLLLNTLNSVISSRRSLGSDSLESLGIGHHQSLYFSAIDAKLSSATECSTSATEDAQHAHFTRTHHGARRPPTNSELVRGLFHQQMQVTRPRPPMPAPRKPFRGTPTTMA